ncbi:MAG: hypothetical protein BWY78_00473 [Alphaproteobacteria bacterium ADurb.Bin438]|nr:MAG: hypothetical protein BWY78_00473 [Alphaproteobacteria bacterium ADurb.Bin438]
MIRNNIINDYENNIFEDNFEKRLRNAITFAWNIFIKKVGSKLIEINKEASMQLQYANILYQLLPIICFEKDESARIELETTVKVDDKNREIDLTLIGLKGEQEIKIAVEMKCYKTLASSGEKRGATNIFMKDVYFDLYLLEQYCAQCGFDKGVSLVMTDDRSRIKPKDKKAKCWDYDISDGFKLEPKKFNTPVGVESINFELKKSYNFHWIKNNNIWFLENEGLDN